MLFGLFWQLIATLTRVYDWRMTVGALSQCPYTYPPER
jgi:hypothetical protein